MFWQFFKGQARIQEQSLVKTDALLGLSLSSNENAKVFSCYNEDFCMNYFLLYALYQAILYH